MNLFHRAGLALAACLGLLTGSASAAPPPGWRTHHNASGEYALSFPASLKLSVPSGQSCSNGICNRIEQVQLTGPDGGMTFAIQRNINPGHLSLRGWFQMLSSQSHAGGTETVMMVGGRQAIRRQAIDPAESVRYLGGKEVAHTSRMLPNDQVFVALNRSDVLTIILHPKNDPASDMFERVLTTIQFSP